MRRTRDLRRARLGSYLLIGLLVLFSLIPFYVMLAASVKSPDEFGRSPYGLPSNPTLSNYADVWTQFEYGKMLFNSAVLSVSSAVVSSLAAIAAAYGFTRFRFRGRRFLLALVVAAMAIPSIVVIIPVFLVMSDLRLVGTYPAAIIAEVGILLPFSIFLLYSYVTDLPRDLFDAAEVDGAYSWQVFVRIVLPMARPALTTTALIAAIFAWSDLLVPLVLWPTGDLETVMTGLALLSESRTGLVDIPLLMAAVVMSIVPLLIVFSVFRTTLIRGLTESSIR